MALIYAFQDTSGNWHGDPDAPLLETTPGCGHLTYQPALGSPEAASPFAGQTLKILYGAVDIDPAPVTYQLDNGGRFPASWQVYALLATPSGSHVQVPPENALPSTPRAERRMDISLTDSGHRYLLTANGNDSELTLTLTAATQDGEVHGELHGTIDPAHLPSLARLLQAAASPSAGQPEPAPTAPSPTSGPKNGSKWTDDERTRLFNRYHHERDLSRLAEEFGRSILSLRYQLFHLGLAPRPIPAHSPTPTPTASRTLATRTGPTHDELRKTHRNSHTPWTDEEEKQLAERCAHNATAEEMSEEFGRTVLAIESRLRMIDAQGPAGDKARMQEF
ncbi:hypothetical protein ACFRCW_19250 [Streptomyces sp. NPDC056653]|uniref:hypothetical protein n=1 Tax=Streptomyces sp. NPDC056653 TaxID=3345894 RepID=UPI0036B17C32